MLRFIGYCRHRSVHTIRSNFNHGSAVGVATSGATAAVLRQSRPPARASRPPWCRRRRAQLEIEGGCLAYKRVAMPCSKQARVCREYKALCHSNPCLVAAILCSCTAFVSHHQSQEYVIYTAGPPEAVMFNGKCCHCFRVVVWSAA